MNEPEGLWTAEDLGGEEVTGEQAPPPQAGISFAHMARMGFAATGPSLSSTGTSPQAASSVWGPMLSHAPALGSSPPPASGWGPPTSAWGFQRGWPSGVVCACSQHPITPLKLSSQTGNFFWKEGQEGWQEPRAALIICPAAAILSVLACALRMPDVHQPCSNAS